MSLGSKAAGAGGPRAGRRRPGNLPDPDHQTSGKQSRLRQEAVGKQPPTPREEGIKTRDSFEYRAPSLYIWIFYALLAAWAAVCIILIGSKAVRSGWALGQLLMIAFVLAYTWYFSLGIAYRLKVDKNGLVELTSFRKTIRLEADRIEAIETPKLPLGFIKFRLEREKVYIFCRVRNQALQRILAVLKSANPEIKFKF